MTIAAIDSEQALTTLSVALVDHDRLFCRGMEMLFEQLSGGEVRLVGHAQQADMVADLIRRRRPDVVIVTLMLPDPGAVIVISQLKRMWPELPVLAMCGNHDHEVALAALQAGAEGVLCKSSPPEALLAPLVSITSGTAVLPGHILRGLLDTASRSRPAHLCSLNPDERRLWRMVADGAETHEISTMLHISERTAKRKVASLLGRLRVNSRIHAAALAGRCGLLDEPMGAYAAQVEQESA